MVVRIDILDRTQNVKDTFNLSGSSVEIDAIERFLYLLNTETYDSTMPDIMVSNILGENSRTLVMPKRRGLQSCLM